MQLDIHLQGAATGDTQQQGAPRYTYTATGCSYRKCTLYSSRVQLDIQLQGAATVDVQQQGVARYTAVHGMYLDILSSSRV